MITAAVVVASAVGWSSLKPPAAAQSSKVLYLTFDDGPDPTFTPLLLDALDRHDAKATFFPVGKRVERRQNLTRNIADRGHAIGNHTYHHSNLLEITDEAIRTEIQAATDIIRWTSGVTVSCFRPPSGTIDDRIRRIAAEANLPVVLWNRGGGDYGLETAEEFLDKVRSARSGDVILLHDNAGVVSLEAAELVLEHFTEQGYRFETVPECRSAETAVSTTSPAVTPAPTPAPTVPPTPAPTVPPTTTPPTTVAATPPPTTPPTAASEPQVVKRAISIRARGTTGDEVIKLRVNRKTVARFVLSSDWGVYTYRPRIDTKVSKVRVFFVNDHKARPGTDRNVEVDYITVHNAVVQTEDTRVKSRGAWSSPGGCSVGFKQTETLACNGWFQYKLKRAKRIG